jgi:leucyl aminopeptidase
LADGISYISDKYKLDRIITVATLTWACMHALGFRYAWIMWNDEDFISKILNYSENNFEKYCRLPFDDYFVEKTKWEIADLENVNKKIYAGSTMWWAFLYNFLMNEEKYTHIDIAWTAINSYEPYWYVNLWMTGFWVDSLAKVIEEL